MRSEKCERGLTLVEVMIVIAIISILAAIAVPNFVKLRQRVRLASCSANLGLIRRAIARYAVDSNLDLSQTVQVEQLVPDYIQVAPVCPSGGTYSTAHGRC